MYRVMIVDDWEVFLRQLKRKVDFEQYGFTVVYEASNGKAAFDYLLEHEVDLIISDIRMPEWDGIDLLKAMREIDIKTPVIFLSEYEDFQYAKQAIHYNITDYLVKPVQQDEVHKKLRELKQQFDERQTKTTKQIEEDVTAVVNNILLKQDLSQHLQHIVNHFNTAAEDNDMTPSLHHIIHLVSDRLLEHHPWLTRFQLPLPIDMIDEKEAFTYLYTAINRIKEPIDLLYETSRHQPLVEKVCQFALNTDEKYTIKTIADTLFVNKNYLADTFKKETNQRLGDYLIKVKIYRAKVLLLTTTEKLYQVSDTLGYKSPEYFSRVFKSETGFTPYQYREKHPVNSTDK